MVAAAAAAEITTAGRQAGPPSAGCRLPARCQCDVIEKVAREEKMEVKFFSAGASFELRFATNYFFISFFNPRTFRARTHFFYKKLCSVLTPCVNHGHTSSRAT